MRLSEIRKVYYNNGILTDAQMKSSRNISIYEGCTARSILTLTSGAFLVGFAHYLGASNQIAGIVAAIPVLAGIITAFSPILFERLTNRKLVTCLFCFIGRLLLGLMIVLPFIKVTPTAKVIMLIAMFLTANLFLAFTMPAAQTWILGITPDTIRGSYCGRRESIVLGTVTVVSLVVGQVLDFFDKSGHPLAGFSILFTLVIVMAVINFILFSSMSEPCNILSNSKISVKNIFSTPLRNKSYMRIALLMVIWNVGFQLAVPFTYVYMVSALHLGYGFITFMSVLASASSVVSVRFWGRLADKRSWMFLFKLMMVIQILCFFIWFFINGSTALILLPITHIIGGSAISGINISINNIQYNHAPVENKTVYMGFSSAANGIFGFAGTLAGSYLLKLVENYNIAVSGFNVGNMQLLFVLAGLILLFGIIFLSHAY